MDSILTGAKRKGADRVGGGTVALGLLVAAIWGFNFVVIKVGVSSVPPLALAALRFFFSAIPAILFVKRPRAPLGRVAAYGLFLGVGEFGFLFTAIKLGAPAGLSSILLQAQAFLTALLAAIFLGERVKLHNIAGMVIAALGLVLFALGSSSEGLTPLLVGMILLAALGWASANVVARKLGGIDALGLMVWSSLFSPLPLAVLSLALEGPRRIAFAFENLSLLTLGAIAYLVVLSTLVGYGLWNTLIMRHGAGKIAPFSLLVPIFGLSSAFIALHEPFRGPDIAASILILAGLIVHVFGAKLVYASRAKRG